MFNYLRQLWGGLQGFPTEDVHLDLWVSQDQIDSSATVSAALPEGRMVELALPPVLKEGHQLRIRNIGGRKYRDAYFHVHVARDPAPPPEQADLTG
jgi:hypothetical protein